MELQEAYREFRDAGAELVAISTDGEADAAAMANDFGLEFPVLYDADEAVTRAWGVYNLHGDELATPSTFVIDTDGTLAWGYVGAHAEDRPHAEQTLAIVRSMATATTPAPGSAADPATPEPGAQDTADVHDFTLPDWTGEQVSLSQYQGDRHVVLVFYRGFW